MQILSVLLSIMQVSGLASLPFINNHRGAALYFGITGLAAVINVFLLLSINKNSSLNLLHIVAGIFGVGIMIFSAFLLLK